MRPPGPIDLHLDANESLNSCIDLQLLASGKSPQLLTRYPNTSTLEAAIALRLGVPSTRVIVTAGGDEAIDRACRAFLKPGTELILPVPTFEMIERYARLAQADVVTSPWREGVFPTQAVLMQVTTRTAMISIVSPKKSITTQHDDETQQLHQQPQQEQSQSAALDHDCGRLMR